MMVEVENLVLEQLRLIREDLGTLKGQVGGLTRDLAEFKAETHSDFMAQKTMLFGLASVIGQVDERVEHPEQKMGA